MNKQTILVNPLTEPLTYDHLIDRVNQEIDTRCATVYVSDFNTGQIFLEFYCGRIVYRADCLGG